MTSYIARRAPMVLIQVNGKPAPEHEAARTGFEYTDRIYKRDEASLILADPDRKFRDKLLRPDDFYKVSWGYPGNMASPRGMRLKSWTTEMGTDVGSIRLRLQVTGREGSKRTNVQVVSELHKTFIPNNWGRLTTSQIAVKIAKRHRLGVLVDDSEDLDRTDHVQPSNVSDYGYLRRLAENIDFEFFIERNVLYYRKKPYSEPPRRTFTYMPTGDDSLLLSFHPDVKVVAASTKPNTVDIEQGDKPYSTAKEAAVGLAAALFVDKQKELGQAIDLLTDEAGESFQTAEALNVAFRKKPSDENAASRKEAYDLLDQTLADLALEKREARANQQVVDKQVRKNKTKKIGEDDKGAQDCPKGQRFEGQLPTGNTKTSFVFDAKRPRKAGRFVKSVLKARLGLVDSTYRTTDSTSQVAQKRACAAHGKRTDKAVTARADFIGDPRLRAKVNYRFQNVGRLFDGNWYSKQAVHSVSESLYTVRMSLKRGTLGKKSGKSSDGKKDKKDNANSNATVQEWEARRGSQGRINVRKKKPIVADK